MTQEKVVEKILSETDLEEDELKEEVEEKMEEFSGLVSEEGAVHLVAKDNGVSISETQEQDIDVSNIVPEMRSLNVKARVVSILEPNTFTRDSGEEGKVQNIVLGDETGQIRVTLWDEQTEIASKVDEGDAIEIKRAYTVEDDRGNAEIRLGDDSKVSMADEEEVGEVQRGGESREADIGDIDTENVTYSFSGTIMDVYTNSPFYRKDPESGETVREDEDGNYVTSDGEEVEDPDNALAVSAVVDDGTGNIRIVMFGEQAREILEIDEESEKEGDMRAVEKGAEKAVGKKLQFTGRTRYNDYFGSLEVLLNEVEEVDTGEQIDSILERLEA